MGRFPKACRPAEYLPAGLEQDLFMTDPGKDEKGRKVLMKPSSL